MTSYGSEKSFLRAKPRLVHGHKDLFKRLGRVWMALETYLVDGDTKPYDGMKAGIDTSCWLHKAVACSAGAAQATADPRVPVYEVEAVLGALLVMLRRAGIIPVF